MVFTDNIKKLFEPRGARARFSLETGISHQNLTKWSGGAFPGIDQIEIFCKGSNISANWLIFGIGPEMLSECRESNREYVSSASSAPKQQTSEFYKGEKVTINDEGGEEKLDQKVKEKLIVMTSEILESNTVYRPALVSNIKAFHHGVKQMSKTDDKVEELNKKMDEMMRMMGSEPEKKQSGDSN